MNKKGASAANQVLGLALVGVLSLVVVGQRLRVDVIGDDCTLLPPLPTHIAYSLVYVIGIALLSAAWMRSRTLQLPLGRVLGLGVAVHLVALLTPPFLSLDSLCYAAIGRAMAVFHQSPYQGLVHSLPVNDPFLKILPLSWQVDTSAYGPAFNELARLVAQAGGDRIIDHLRLYQLIGVACMAGTAALVGLAAGEQRHAGARAAAMVLFCPIAIVEGTMNAHNDVLLALSVGAFALLMSRKQAGILPLCVGLTIKASGALLLGVHAAHGALVRMNRRLRPDVVLALGAIFFALLLVTLVVVGSDRESVLYQFARLLGRPDDHVPHFTRSVEALPRAFLHFVVGAPRAGWALGLVFRWLAGLWLLWAGLRGARSRDPLRWGATALFGYYLFFHGYMQSWYLLSLVPLLPFADSRLRPAMETFCVTSLLYYAVHMPMNCVTSPGVIVTREIIEATIVIVPPAWLLWRARRPLRP